MNSFVLSLQATSQGVALTWPDVPGATGYEVHRRQGLGPSDAPFAVIAMPQEAAYMDTETAAGVGYTYRIDVVPAEGANPHSWPAEIIAAGPEERSEGKK